MNCTTHNNHEHKHGTNCGHKGIKHEDHIDYLHEDHLHHMHEDHVDEHSLSQSNQNKSACTPDHSCATHDKSHKHGIGCGHDAVPHDNHVDYLVGEHLHHPCNDHCDHHGYIAIA
jgi:hypothetical protein